ncbi:MAG: ABC transporter permease [Thermodesulfobacteriota bacterium]
MIKRLRLEQLLHLTVAHGKEVSRQPAVLFWGIIFPILISLGLGMAFTRSAETVHSIAVVNQGPGPSASAASGDGSSPVDRFLEQHARKTVSGNGPATYRLTLENPKLGDTTFVFRKTEWADAIRRVKRGKTGVIMRQAGSETTYHFDPANPEAQLTYLKVSKLISGRAAPDVFPDAAGAAIRKNVEPLSVTGTRYIDFLVPGLISMGLMMSCMWGISYGTIEKRSKKLLRRMVATPMKKAYFLIALMIVRITMNIIEAGLLFFFAWLVFDISVQGSLGALAAIFIAGNIAFGGLAILTASHTANTEIGNGLINATVLPLTILSGIFFSYHNFPDWSIPVIQKLPLALLSDGIRSIFIEGAGWPETAMPILLLTAMGVAFFSLGLKVFKWH